MNVFSVQITVLVFLLVGNILFGSIPSLLIKVIGHFSNNEDEWNRKIKWATFMLYVGGGVFISDSFLVLLPQVDKEFSNTEHRSPQQSGNSTQTLSEEYVGHHHDGFPIPEFIVLGGFFFAYVMQETVLSLLAKLSRTTREATDMGVRFCTCAKRHTECSRTFKDARPDQTLFGLEKKLMESGCASDSAAANIPPEAEVTAKSELLRSSILAQAVPNYGTVTNVAEPAIDNPLPILATPVLLEDERRIVMEQRDETRYQNKFLINSMLIIIALTLQYIFWGIHLGLRTEQFKRWSYLLVVCLQNFMLTFSAGSYLAVVNMELSYIVLFIGLLSTVSPMGLVAAMVAKNAVEEIPHLAKGIVSAVACGTLLYTTFYEMLRQKSFGSVVGLTKFLAILMGASVMVILQYAMLTL